jgi:hypothetical protein
MFDDYIWYIWVAFFNNISGHSGPDCVCACGGGRVSVLCGRGGAAAASQTCLISV